MKEQLQGNVAQRNAIELVGLISRISNRLMRASASQTDEAIHEALRDLSEQVGADRAFLGRLSADGKALERIVEWCPDEGRRVAALLEGRPLERFGWWADRVLGGEVLHVHSTMDQLPDSPDALAHIQKTGSGSFVAAPLVCGGPVVGIIAVGAQQEQAWADHAIALLQAVGEIVLNAMERQRSDQELARERQRLRASEEKYRHVVEHSNDGICVLQDGQIAYANQHMADIVGYTLAEGLGQPYTLFLPPDQHEENRARYDSLFAGEKETLRFEATLVGKDARRVEAELNVSVTEFDGRKAALLFIRDVTERKRTGRKLREAERDREIVLATVPDVVVYLDREMRVVWANRAASESAGHPAEELVGRRCYEIWQDTGKPCPDCPVRATFETGDPHEGETTSKGGRAWNVRAFPVRGEDGQTVGAVEVASEITDRKRAESELRKVRDFSAQLVQASPTFFVAIGADGKTLMMNRAMLDTLGYAADEVVGKDYLAAFVPESDREALAGIFRTLGERGRIACNENHVLTRDGRELLVEWHGRPVFRPDGTLDFRFGVGIDITERKSIEEQLRQAQKMEAIGRLAGGIAHDFNNQLTIVKGYSDLLLAGADLGGDVHDSLREIQHAAERATLMTRRLLTFGRRQVLRPEVINLNDVIEHLAEPLGRMIGEDIELRIDSAADLGSVHADPGQVEQALMNLVVNARDAMPAGGELTIRTANVESGLDLAPPQADAPDAPHVRLAVRDTGLGMDEATRERIFEPFFTTKPVGQGTGLGLAMVYAFVRESGGHIHVTSEEARGTTFSIYLPRVSTPAEDQTGQARAKRDCRGDETILVAEDDPSVRQLVVRVLRQYGYTVLESTSARNALAIGQQPDRTIHLLVTDVVMPGMNGRELAEHLQAARPDLPVLYISGYAESALGSRPQERPDPFLRKPFPPETLAREVRRVLDAAAVP